MVLVGGSVGGVILVMNSLDYLDSYINVEQSLLVGGYLLGGHDLVEVGPGRWVASFPGRPLALSTLYLKKLFFPQERKAWGRG
jgi:hypothetical protein